MQSHPAGRAVLPVGVEHNLTNLDLTLRLTYKKELLNYIKIYINFHEII